MAKPLDGIELLAYFHRLHFPKVVLTQFCGGYEDEQLAHSHTSASAHLDPLEREMARMDVAQLFLGRPHLAAALCLHEIGSTPKSWEEPRREAFRSRRKWLLPHTIRSRDGGNIALPGTCRSPGG